MWNAHLSENSYHQIHSNGFNNGIHAGEVLDVVATMAATMATILIVFVRSHLGHPYNHSA
jgi:hypothetical protein